MRGFNEIKYSLYPETVYLNLQCYHKMKFVLTALLILLATFSIDAQTALSKADFQNPPASSKLHTWWHWMDGNITKEGITKDLEAMKLHGIVGATVLNVGAIYSKEVDVPKVKFNSPEWYAMFHWALQEANRLGITIGFQNCDGWSTSGGPWITPELSMKQYVWTKTEIEGGMEINTALAQPVSLEGFYKDVAVVAFPAEEKPNSFHQDQARIKLNKLAVGDTLTDGNPKTAVNLKKGAIIDVNTDTAFTADKLSIFPYLPFCWDDMGKITVQLTLSSSNDGNVYTKVADLEFIGVNKSIMVSFPETKARFFRVALSKTNFSFFDTYPIAEFELLKNDEEPTFNPAISSFLQKTADVFDVKENVHDTSVNNSKKAIAENAVIDISAYMSADGKLKWKAPEGQWNIVRFGYTSTGIKNNPATPEGLGLEVDKMDTTALNVHFNSFAKKVIESAGAYKGNTLKFVLMDSWEARFQTWSNTFSDEFKQRRGYDLLSWIPVLCGETVGSVQLSEAFLHDYRKTIADLIDQNYYKHFSELCHLNQMEFHGEAIYSNWGGYPPSDPLKANQYMDVPMTEFWAENDANMFANYKPANRPAPGFPMSSALAYDKQLIGSEAYTNYAHYSETSYDLKPFGDAAYCSGVNQLILHSFVHQPFDKKPGMTLGKFGAHFNRNNPVWEFNRDWMAYQSRVQYVLQKGIPVIDVVFYSGDQLPQFFSKSFLDSLPFGIEATACNIDMLKARSKVINGKISFGGKQSFALLMLPNSTKMEYAILQRIAELVKDGAIVYGPKPLQMLAILEIKNDAVAFTKLAEALWGDSGENNYGKGKMISGRSISDVLSELNIIPDLTTNTKNPKEIMYIHRKLENADVYYVFNQQNKNINREVLFRISNKSFEIWNPENGSISKPAIYSVEKNQTRIPVSFKPYESKIFVFKNEVPDHFIQQISLDGKKIFPQQYLSDTTFVIPYAFVRKEKIEFTSKLSGDYTFTTNHNNVIKAKLSQPEMLDLGHLKTRIEFFPISNEAIQPVEITTLKSLTEFDDPAIKYFAGKARYSIDFSVPENFTHTNDSIVLDLGNLGATAEVILNGQLLAYAWQPNTSLVVTGKLKAENKLQITMATVCRNRFIGDLVQFGSVKSLWTTSPIETILNKDMPLRPSGLMGPLKLMSFKNISKYVDVK